MLTVTSLSRIRFVSILVFLIVGMYLTHVSEAIIFIVLLCISSFIVSNRHLRLTDALLASLIGIVLVGGFLLFVQYGWRSEIPFSKLLPFSSSAIIATLIVVIATLVWKQYLSPKIGLNSKKINFVVKRIVSKKNFYRVIISALLVTYIVGLFTWEYAENFTISPFYDSGIAPWFIYPMMFGIVGLLAIVSMRFVYVFPENSNNRPQAKDYITTILFFIIILFVFGRIVSFLNTNYTHTGYWEKRFLSYIFLMCAMVAPIPLIGFYETIRKTFNKHLSRTLTVLFVSMVMILGFSSLVIQIEYLRLSGKGSNTISDDELSAISFLQDKMAEEKDSFIVTPTKTSAAVISIAGPKYPFSFFDILSSSKEPAMPIYAIDTYNSKHTFLYIHDRDYNFLLNSPDNWLFSHLLPMLRPIYSNDEVSVYEIPSLSFPQPSSNTVLLTPSDERTKRWLYAQDILSLTAANYSVRADNGEDSYLEKSKILGYDPKVAINLNHSFSTEMQNSLMGYRKLSGNWTIQKDGLHAESDAADPFSIHRILSPIRHIRGESLNLSASVLIKESIRLLQSTFD